MSCVTPARRLDGREVTTLEGLPEAVRSRWADALVTSGGSQCGFCTPGIVMRLAALAGGGSTASTTEAVDVSLLAHLCRCTGWQTIEEAARAVFASERPPSSTSRDLEAAAARAGIEGGVPQRVGPEVALGRAGFADDGRPAGSLVAVPDAEGRYVVADTTAAARAGAGKVQGRSTSLSLTHPVTMPVGSWDLALATTWVEPAYVEPDASWAAPGGEPASACANGGAFGGKRHSPVAADARRLADEHGRPVAVRWTREDVVRLGPKRPPVAGGIRIDGTGVLRVGLTGDGVDPGRWEAVCALVASVAPRLVLEPVPVVGPPVSFDLRAAVWAEAAVLVACAREVAKGGGTDACFDVPIEVRSPAGGRAVARCLDDGSFQLRVDAGAVLDEVVLRSYAVGATHQALGWVRSEGIAVDDRGAVCDLTVRSFGVLQARAMPHVEVTVVVDTDRPPVNGSDAVFAAVAAACWLADGLAPRWPTDRSGVGRR